MKGAVEATDRRTERVMKGVQGFGEERVLNGDVHGGQFEVLRSIRRRVHVAIHGHVFVQAP